MHKQMICSRATEEHIEATWCAWEWPHREYLQEHHKHWLSVNCEQYWLHVSRTLYFQLEEDLHAWCVAHSQAPTLAHTVVLGRMDYVDRQVRELWCKQQWGPDLYQGKCWPQGTWTCGYVPTVGACMQFAHAEQAVQFSLTWSHT
jgi:hypothetical protein